jgi:hypothetical protein
VLSKDAHEIIISQPTKSSPKCLNPIELIRIHNAIGKIVSLYFEFPRIKLTSFPKVMKN